MRNKIKILLKEYLSQDMVSLKRYFTMSNEERKEYLPSNYCYLFDNFLNDNGIDFQYDDENQHICDVVYSLENEEPKLYQQFKEWLYKGVEKHNLPINDSEYPTWSFFGDAPQLIKNQWLIHFTDDAESIKEDGFKFGVNEMDKLGLTTHLSDFDKKYGGYNFAYTLNDYLRYAKANSRTFKYGTQAVLFNASGIKLWHYADEEPQVIFYGNTAKNIIPITEGENAKYGVFNTRRNYVIYENDDFDKVVDWVIKNYVQYKNHL